MSRLTLRLPESLHQNLARQARTEGVSLNQMIVYLLTRMTGATDLDEQRRVFEGLLHRYPAEEAETALQEILAARTPP
ncbi:MAG: toxin-antitoxin system HicB family antitoxin [bacterium]|nr:toxin-antitoxin system HicB family antitoxin [bacterium]